MKACRLVSLLGVSPLVVSLVACASSPEPPPPSGASVVSSYEEGVPGGVTVGTVELNARVVDIDREARKLTLLGPEGETFEVGVGPEAVNFGQIEKGDLVTATLTEELVIAMADAAEVPEDSAAAAVALAPVGARPGGVSAGIVRVFGTVTAIDPEARTATLEFADGTTRTFGVRPDIDLSRHRVGEKVVFQITERIAIDVREP